MVHLLAPALPEVVNNSAGESAMKERLGALPLSYAGIIPAAGFEPATTRSIGEVTLIFTTGRNHRG